MIFQTLTKPQQKPQKPPPPPEREAALERQWAFSSASEGQRLGTIALGVANLAGVLFLGNLLRDPAVARAVTQSSLGFMTGLLPFLQARLRACLIAPSILVLPSWTGMPAGSVKRQGVH